MLVSSKDNPFENDDEVFIISELIRYLEHQNSGLVPLDQMNRDWPKIVADIQAGHPVSSKAPEISEMVTTWHQEARDVALLMTRQIKEPVTISIKREQVGDHAAWVEDDIKSFCSDKRLRFDLDIPHTASKIYIEADFLRRAIRASMKLAAPADKASNSARINWLLRQFKKSDISKISIRCITKGKAQNFGAMAHEIEPSSEEIKNLSAIGSFQIEMSSDLGAKFNSRKKFIEQLEDLVPQFYENVGQHLQALTPAPPRISKNVVDSETSAPDDKTVTDAANDDANERSDRRFGVVAPPSMPIIRPSWASQWQNDQRVEKKQFDE